MARSRAHDYLALAERLAPDVDQAACQLEMVHRLGGLTTAPPPVEVEVMSAEELQARLREALAFEGLLARLDEAPAEVKVVDEVERDGRTEQLIEIRDGERGAFRVFVMWPPGPGPHPGVIALPGHPDTHDPVGEWMDRMQGRAWVDAGFALAVPSWRAFDGWHAESQATTALLCAGSSLLAVRQYEVLLVDRVLRGLERPARIDRVGLVAHSGGSALANVLVRHVFTFGGLVMDGHSGYAWGLPCEELPGSAWCVQEESHPEIQLLREMIHDASTAPRRVPVLTQPYGYPDGPAQGISFMRRHLVEGGAPAVRVLPAVVQPEEL